MYVLMFIFNVTVTYVVKSYTFILKSILLYLFNAQKRKMSLHENMQI